MQIQYKLQYLLERLFYYASGTTCMHVHAHTYYVNYVISEHNKPQIFIENKEKSL